MIRNEVVRATIQLTAFLIIPTLYWLVIARKRSAFLLWLGVKSPMVRNKFKFSVLFLCGILLAVLMSLVLDPLSPNDLQLANARFAGKGMVAIVPAFIFSLFATALPEELFFRHFLGVQVFEKLGFFVANTIQAVIFGFLHGATLFSTQHNFLALLVIFFTGALGWLMGYLNREANHSVFPSVILHAFANFYASMLLAFTLLQP